MAHALAWSVLLEGPRAALVEVLTGDFERARELRQSTPFVGVLEPRERWALWAEVARGAGP